MENYPKLLNKNQSFGKYIAPSSGQIENSLQKLSTYKSVKLDIPITKQCHALIKLKRNPESAIIQNTLIR
jgi:hypothetical protein